jgi:hypothetical protein
MMTRNPIQVQEDENDKNEEEEEEDPATNSWLT